MPEAKYEIQRKCKICGNTFLIKSLDSKYCSRRCMNIAYKRRRKEEIERQRLDAIAEKIPDAQDLISVPEAEALFAISRKTIYRLIRDEKIQSVNIGVRLTKVSRAELETFLPLRSEPIDRSRQLPKMYNMEPENCYTIGEVHTRFKVSEATIYKVIRDRGIPMRQIGKFVYVPKEEINEIFK